ncbi:ammonium transporter [Ponticaulis profundi]|uniref:Ammonium transporter n=1 Tax=Ponticaulis profundi TaxID=2665222 RepID=A0ABW1S4Z4_9PROT
MKRSVQVLLSLAMLNVFLPQAHAAQSSLDIANEDIGSILNSVWVLIAAALVMMMQVGFLLLEAGMVRSKNSINVAMKNVMDFTVSALAFALIGFMIAFGGSSILPFGLDLDMLALNELDSGVLVFFIFQVMFCGTAATIVSGGVAERMRLSSYTIGALVIGAIIYPVFAHWAWGNALGNNGGAFLANLGFVDFAGSTVVHATGGWLALAACIVLGARKGRFDREGKPIRFSGHSTVLAATGAFLLYIGWIGFNGGSTLEANTSLGLIIVNTVLAGSVGTLVGYLWTMARDRTVLPEKVLCGMIGGLVAVTAGCAVLNVPGALAIGALGALATNASNELLERYFRIDDAVGAIGAHAVAGVVGTIGLALFAAEANLPTASRWDQLIVQLLGSGLNFIWAFGLGILFFSAMKALMGIRVADTAEDCGLNESEHGTRLGIGHVEEAMDHLVRGTADLNARLPVEAGDEAERLVLTFNALLDNLQEQEKVRFDAVENQRSVEEAERLTALADATFEALCLSVDGVIIDGNAALGRLLGLEMNDVRGRKLSDFLPEQHVRDVEELVATRQSAARELTVLNELGEAIPVEVRGRDISLRNRKTRVLAIVDIRERKKAEARIRYLAQHDPLTNLPNRALFNERLHEMIERTMKQGVLSAVILIDLDRFKDINDLYGHGAGDEVLKETSERLKMHVSKRDSVARLGGDEFAILQIDINFTNQSADLALRLLQELNRPITLTDGNRVHVGASIGIAICPRDGIDGVSLISRADTALYHSKSMGRNRYAIFENGMDEHVRRRQLIELDLKNALEDGQFKVHYQPRLNTRTGKIASYEALIRWHHPTRGMVSPAEFIPVAEGCGQIIKIGEWVLRTACLAAARDMKSGRVSVNASPFQVRDKNFIETVRRALEDSGLEPSRLEIEITENVLIDDDQRALSIFNALKRLGVKIALDDFGTGYSSLSYLSRFPFDSIKIDRSFVQGLDHGGSGLEIIDTIVRLGRALNMNIVAEGVETQSAFATLIACGCDEIQGFLVGAAEPLENILEIAPSHIQRTISTSEQVASLQEMVRRMEREELDRAREQKRAG